MALKRLHFPVFAGTLFAAVTLLSGCEPASFAGGSGYEGISTGGGKGALLNPSNPRDAYNPSTLQPHPAEVDEIRKLPGVHTAVIVTHQDSAYVAVVPLQSGPVTNHKVAGSTFMTADGNNEDYLRDLRISFLGGDRQPSFGAHSTRSNMLSQAYLNRIDQIIKAHHPEVHHVYITTNVQTAIMMRRMPSNLNSGARH